MSDTKKVPFKEQLFLILQRSREYNTGPQEYGESFGPEAVEAMKHLHKGSSKEELMALDDKILDAMHTTMKSEVRICSNAAIKHLESAKCSVLTEDWYGDNDELLKGPKSAKRKNVYVGMYTAFVANYSRVIHTANAAMMTLVKIRASKVKKAKNNMSKRGTKK